MFLFLSLASVCLFFDSPIVVTVMKINSVTSFYWNTKILNVVFTPHIFTSKLEISAFSCLRCQLLTLNYWLGDPEGSWISSPKLSSNKKRSRERKSQFPLGKYPPGHTCITQRKFFTTTHLLIPVSEKNTMTWFCPWEQDGGKYFTAENQQPQLRWPSARRNNG